MSRKWAVERRGVLYTVFCKSLALAIVAFEAAGFVRPEPKRAT